MDTVGLAILLLLGMLVACRVVVSVSTMYRWKVKPSSCGEGKERRICGAEDETRYGAAIWCSS